MNHNITGIILAGGKSSRMGRDKGLLKIGGKPLIEHVYSALFPLVSSIIISSNSDKYNYLKATVVCDENPGIGPIGGIKSSLEKSNTEYNLITTCDVPLLSTDFYEFMISSSNNYDLTIPSFDGFLQPTIGVYHKNLLSIIDKYIKENVLGPVNIFKHCNRNVIKISNELSFYKPFMFRSINTPKDYEIIRKTFFE